MRGGAVIRSAVVYCASADGVSPVFAGNAARLGRYLAENGIRLVYGGAAVGNMKTLADAVLESGGEVTGVFPTDLAEKILHPALTETIIVNSLAERKRIMLEKADAVVALPGGLGTLDELFDAASLRKLNIHRKPCGLLNVNGFYDDLIRFLNHTVECGFLQEKYRTLIQAAETPEELFRLLDGSAV